MLLRSSCRIYWQIFSLAVFSVLAYKDFYFDRAKNPVF